MYGSNYAFGGSKMLHINAQVSNYQQNVDNIADTEATYIIWGGGNDLLDIIVEENSTHSIDIALSHLESAIRRLSSIGAKTIIVPNQINLAYVPRLAALNQVTPDITTNALNITTQFNASLKGLLDTLESENISTIHFDSFSLFETLYEDVITSGENSGISNATEACYINIDAIISLCENSSQYLFWDDLHPTTAVHSQIADNMFETLQNNATN